MRKKLDQYMKEKTEFGWDFNWKNVEGMYIKSDLNITDRRNHTATSPKRSLTLVKDIFKIYT